MAVKIRLLRMGKIRNPQYRIVVADSRTKRDGRAIEFVGHLPAEGGALRSSRSSRSGSSTGSPSARSRARRCSASWSKTGDWQKFKGLPAPPPLKVAAAAGRPQGGRTRPRRRPPPAWPETPAKPAKKAAKAEPKAEAAKAEAAGRGRRPRPRPPRPRRRPVPTPASRPDMALRPALEHLVKGIVDHPDDVRVRMVDSRRGKRLEVRVHPEDLGTVIGAVGRTAKALRQVIGSIGGRGRTRRHRRLVLMLLVVGRIGKPHGIRGEVTVEVRTDEPEAALRRRLGAAHRAGASPGRARRRSRCAVRCRRADHRVGALAPGPAAGRLRGRAATATSPRRCAAPCSAVDSADVAAAGGPGRVPRPPAGRARRGRPRPASGSARWSGSTTRPPPTCWCCAAPTGATALVPFVKAIVPEVDLAGGRVVVDPPAGLLDL